MERDTSELIDDALHQPATAITYSVSKRLHALFPDKAMLESDHSYFGLEQFAQDGQSSLNVRKAPYPQQVSHWAGTKGTVLRRGVNLWYEVDWKGEQLDVLALHWSGGFGGDGSHYYILADSNDVAERFFAEVCRWNTELRDEVLVFEGGCWHKDPALFRDIKGATVDNLVLRGTLKRDIYEDLAGFFRAQETYERYGVPWKRGILFVGPPGNGKTHGVKALVNALGRDCLYVKSFRSQMPDEYSIHNVFARARMAAPCILILEDLDSLITAQNRSFFLNELDGFAGNHGILTLATTNHPERLDPAIVDRPSRFDRKYPFDLPGQEERATYIGMWNGTLQPELRLSDDGLTAIAATTEGFSFAYLKELFVSATMRWISTSQPGSMDDVMAEQVEVLRDQMASAISFESAAAQDGMTDEQQIFQQFAVSRGMNRGWFSYSNLSESEEIEWGDEMEE